MVPARGARRWPTRRRCCSGRCRPVDEFPDPYGAPADGPAATRGRGGTYGAGAARLGGYDDGLRPATQYGRPAQPHDGSTAASAGGRATSATTSRPALPAPSRRTTQPAGTTPAATAARRQLAGGATAARRLRRSRAGRLRPWDARPTAATLRPAPVQRLPAGGRLPAAAPTAAALQQPAARLRGCRVAVAPTAPHGRLRVPAAGRLPPQWRRLRPGRCDDRRPATPSRADTTSRAATTAVPEQRGYEQGGYPPDGYEQQQGGYDRRLRPAAATAGRYGRARHGATAAGRLEPSRAASAARSTGWTTDPTHDRAGLPVGDRLLLSRMPCRS